MDHAPLGQQARAATMITHLSARALMAVATQISQLWMPFRVVEGSGLSPGVRVWVISARGVVTALGGGAPAPSSEPVQRARGRSC